VSLSGGAVSPVLTPFNGTSFTESPDGKSVLSMQDGVRQAVITDLQTGVEQVVAPDVFGYTYEPLWSSDGEWLAMSGLVRGEDSGVWAWNLDNQEAVLISESEGTEYTWASGDELLICRDVGKGELWLVDADAGGTGDRIDDYVKSPGPHPDTDECLGDDMDVRVVRR
jgi:hypothetical protein